MSNKYSNIIKCVTGLCAEVVAPPKRYNADVTIATINSYRAMEKLERLNMEQLRSFVSDEIFQFLSSPCNNQESDSTQFNNMAINGDLLESEVDELLFECHLQYESLGQPSTSAISQPAPPNVPLLHLRVRKKFKRRKTQPYHTKPLQIQGLWEQWCSTQATKYGDTIPSLNEITTAELAHHMSNFVFELQKKKHGSEFPPESIHHIVSGLQHHVH